MALNDKTKKIILIVVWAAIVLSIILSFAETRFKEQKTALAAHPIKSLRLAGNIEFLITIPLVISLIALAFYSDHLRNKVDTIKLAGRLRTTVLIIPWIIITLLILTVIRFILTLHYHSDHLVLTSVKFLLLCLCMGFLLLYSWPIAQYCRKKPLHIIVTACLLEQHDKFFKANKFDKAYFVLLKACETEPEDFLLWCKLALFCERTRKNSAEADKYMAKANELIMTTKANDIRNKACYLDYLGLINYVRGEHDKDRKSVV
jgi:hypothetical protein